MSAGAPAGGGGGRVLITGASGFVGGHVAARLAATGRPVRCLVRATSSRRWLEPLEVEYALGDVTDAATLPAACEGVDAVIHCAGVTNAAREARYFEVNVRGTERLWRAATEGGVRRFVQISSLAAAGPSRGPVPQDESAEPGPVNAYGKSKLAGERAVLDAAGEAGTPEAVVVRPPAVYGPQDPDVLTLVRGAARLGLFPLALGGGRALSLVEARDLAEGIRLALERGRPGGVYYLTDGVVHTLPEVGEAIARALGRRVRAVPVPYPALWLGAAAGEVSQTFLGRAAPLNFGRLVQFRLGGWTATDARARRELGYASEIDLERGMKETVEWYRSAGWI